MPVGAYNGPNVSTGNGVSTVFAYTFQILDASDLKVTVAGATMILTTDYTVSGVGDAGGGNVTFVVAPANGAEVVRSRVRPYTRATDYQRNGAFDEQTVDQDFDSQEMQIQQIVATVARCFKAPESVSADQALTDAAWAARASKFLGFNAAGAYGAYSLTTTALVVSAFVETLVDDLDADSFVQTLVAALTAEAAPAVDDVVLLGDTSEGKGNKMTLANLLKVVNLLTEDIAPDKAADYLLTYDASAAAVKKVLAQTLPLPRSYLAGGILSNNAGDATNDIDVTAGACRDSTDAVNIRWGALTKQLDAAFAAGTNQGGRSADALANGVWHVYAIRKDVDGSGDILFDTDAAAPSMPAGYTFFRRIGSIIRSGGAILAFVQNGDEFLLKATINDVSVTNLGAAATLFTLTVPTGIKVLALMYVQMTNAGVGVVFRISSPDQNDETADLAAGRGTGQNNVAARYAGGHVETRTNTSGQIRAVSDTASTTLEVGTYGWIDARGRDD